MKMKKYNCVFDIHIEEIIEAGDKQEAEEEFWKNHDLSEIDVFLTIKEYRKKQLGVNKK